MQGPPAEVFKPLRLGQKRAGSEFKTPGTASKTDEGNLVRVRLPLSAPDHMIEITISFCPTTIRSPSASLREVTRSAFTNVPLMLPRSVRT